MRYPHGAVLLITAMVMSGCASSSERSAQELAQELCDVQILYGPEPASPAGRDRWEDFAEKGSELVEMESAGDYRYIGAAAEQLASETRAEVSRGGGKAAYENPDNLSWYEVAGGNWENTGDAWATLCIELVL